MDTAWLLKTRRQLWLILWKNLIIRKRHYILTAVEIILPSLFAICLAYGRSNIPNDSQIQLAQYYGPIYEQV